MDYNNRQFMIFSVTELNQIDFTQVCETSIDTVRKSTDELKTKQIYEELINNINYELVIETSDGNGFCVFIKK